MNSFLSFIRSLFSQTPVNKMPFKNKKPLLISFYLPQFHPIPENNLWWGNGFTEWTNVVKAKPLFPGHQQPKLPADLGFYDLRLPEVRKAQAEMAMEYGIDGFCYYHYWFAGRRLLERPFNEVLKQGEPELPFCLCWANQTWTGIWHGEPNRILIEQTYPGRQDYINHFSSLVTAFHDKRYIKVNGKPLFLVFHPTEIPNQKEFTGIWNDLAIKNGLPGIYFIGWDHGFGWKPLENGFDSKMPMIMPKLNTNPNIPTVYDYKDIWETFIPNYKYDGETALCLKPNWDNTPRSENNGMVFLNSSPEIFKKQLNKGLKWISDAPKDRQIIFIKAWNEWAEGNYLEPDTQTGFGYLDVIKSEINSLYKKS
jgi:hypothetical protein